MNGLGCLVVVGEVVIDRLDQFGHTAEDTPTNALVGEIAKEALDHVGPRCTGRGEAHVEAGVLLQPGLHVGVLVGGVIISGQMQFLAGGRLIVNQPQELRPFLWVCCFIQLPMTVPLRVFRAANKVVVPWCL